MWDEEKIDVRLKRLSSVPINIKIDHDSTLLSRIRDTYFDEYHYYMIRLAAFAGYYILGYLVYSNLEGWDTLDAFYFITQTVSTVGYGNITPVTKSAQMFTAFYIFVGMMMIFTIVNDITKQVLVEHLKKGYKKPLPRSKIAIIVRNVLNACMWIVILLLVVIFGAVVFSGNEGWDFETGFYFAAYTCTSVGYGDLNLQKDSSIIFNMFYILVSVSLVGVAFDKLANLKRHIDAMYRKQLMNQIELNEELIDAIHAENPNPFEDDPIINSSDYVLHMLLLEGKINLKHDVVPWRLRFREFDVTNDGYLTYDDCKQVQKILKMLPNHKVFKNSYGKKKSMVQKVSHEIRDVFLETIKLKEPNKEFTRWKDLFRTVDSMDAKVNASRVSDATMLSKTIRSEVELAQNMGRDENESYIYNQGSPNSNIETKKLKRKDSIGVTSLKQALEARKGSQTFSKKSPMGSDGSKHLSTESTISSLTMFQDEYDEDGTMSDNEEKEKGKEREKMKSFGKLLRKTSLMKGKIEPLPSLPSGKETIMNPLQRAHNEAVSDPGTQGIKKEQEQIIEKSYSQKSGMLSRKLGRKQSVTFVPFAAGTFDLSDDDDNDNYNKNVLENEVVIGDDEEGDLDDEGEGEGEGEGDDNEDTLGSRRKSRRPTSTTSVASTDSVMTTIPGDERLTSIRIG